MNVNVDEKMIVSDKHKDMLNIDHLSYVVSQAVGTLVTYEDKQDNDEYGVYGAGKHHEYGKKETFFFEKILTDSGKELDVTTLIVEDSHATVSVYNEHGKRIAIHCFELDIDEWKKICYLRKNNFLFFG